MSLNKGSWTHFSWFLIDLKNPKEIQFPLFPTSAQIVPSRPLQPHQPLTHKYKETINSIGTTHLTENNPDYTFHQGQTEVRGQTQTPNTVAMIHKS